jgi:hypothetical protein
MCRSGAPSNKKSGTSHASSTARRAAVCCRLPCNRHSKLVSVRTGSVLFARSAARLSWRLPVLNLRSMYGQCVWYEFLLRCQSAICICAPAARLLTGLLTVSTRTSARDARLKWDPLRKLRGSFLYQFAARASRPCGSGRRFARDNQAGNPAGQAYNTLRGQNHPAISDDKDDRF